MEKEIISAGPEITRKLGEAFAKEVVNGGIVSLCGGLGAGKTTFVQGLAKGLGIKQKVVSPTFVMVRKLRVPRNRNERKGNFYHIDLYRLENQDDVESIGLSEIIDEQGSITVIEWPEKSEHMLPKKRWEIYFHTIDDTSRRLSISKRG